MDKEQVKRINNVLFYIEHNLSNDLKIDELASIACYSKFHFNRIFKSIIGESVYHYIKRIRVERANYYLWATYLSIEEIAIKCGFGSISNFSYNYKKHFGISARNQRKIYNGYKDLQSDFQSTEIDVEIKTLPSMTLAYEKKIGSYDTLTPNDVINLFNWAESEHYCKSNFELIVLGYDSPYVTKEKHLRADLGLVVPDDIESQDDVSLMKLSKLTVASLKIPVDQTAEYCRNHIDMWIRKNGYESIIGVPTFYIHYNLKGNRSCIDSSECIVEICVPVKPGKKS